MPVDVEKRVDDLETVVARFVTQTEAAFLRQEKEQEKTQRAVRALSREMRDFKEEMRDFKDEMKAFKDEMKAFKDEMKAFKDEMLVFKDGMENFRDEMRADNIRMNKRWGEIANKMGKMVEDLIYPSLGRIIREQYDFELEDLMIRRKRTLDDGRQKEFDAIAIAGDKVFLNSTKSTLYKRDVDEFIEDIKVFREFYPEYKELPLIGILASLEVDESILNYAEKKGFLVLAVGEEIMEVKNRPGFRAKEW